MKIGTFFYLFNKEDRLKNKPVYISIEIIAKNV